MDINNKISFLDVLLIRENNIMQKTIYKKVLTLEFISIGIHLHLKIGNVVNFGQR